MSFMYRTMMTRGPNKRKIKINEQNLLNLMTNSEDEDEEDEDFTISNVKDKEEAESDEEDNSTDADTSDNNTSESNPEERGSKLESEDQPGCSSRVCNRKPARKRKKPAACPTVKELNAQITSEYYGVPSSTIDILTQAKKQWKQSETMVSNMKTWPSAICSICLNEEKLKISSRLLACQKCGISVHEGCYQMHRSDTRKINLDEIWICDSCIYGGADIVCQFCPNLWGCMKETKCGRWVHVVCARNILVDFLYNVPDTSRQTVAPNPTLYIQLNDRFLNNCKQYGQKECVLCEDRLVAKTGICIKCDAGLCKSSFHVTCAQRHGLLSKARSITDTIHHTSSSSNSGGDTYIANCPLHCDKEEMKKRQRNFILQLKTSQLKRNKLGLRNPAEQNFVSSKITASREVRLNQFDSYTPPRPSLEQYPRLLSSDAHFTRLLNSKTEKMFGITTKVPAMVIPKPTEIRKRHFVAPSLTTDFSAYFLDRQLRIEEEKSSLSSATNTNRALSRQQEYERLKYNKIRSSLLACKSNRSDLKIEYENLKHSILLLSEWAALGKPVKAHTRRRKTLTPVKRRPSRELSVSPPAIKEHIPDEESIIDLKSCGICKGQQSQHLLVRCDVCREWQHLGCLDPPLTQMPKRTKFSLWQCSECAVTSGSSSSESEMENRGSFTNKDGRRLTRRMRRAPEKLAIGFSDSSRIRCSKGSIGHPKCLSKQQRRLREALNAITRQQQLQKRLFASEHTTSLKCSEKTEEVANKETSPKKSHASSSANTSEKRSPNSTLRLGVSCDNYLSQAARIPIITQTKLTPQPRPHSPKQMRKIIILKKSIFVPHRPIGLGQSKKQFILLNNDTTTKQKCPENAQKKTEKICDVCKSAEDHQCIVTCHTCRMNYHWKCCDPPLKANPVTKFATWECSDCVNKKEDDDQNWMPVEGDSGSSVTRGRRATSRKRKPPDLFEPVFKVSNQQKIFKFIQENLKKIETVSSAARCRTLEESGWLPKRRCVPTNVCTMPLQVFKSIARFRFPGFKTLSIVNRDPGRIPSVINLIPRPRPSLVSTDAKTNPSSNSDTNAKHPATEERVPHKEKMH